MKLDELIQTLRMAAVNENTITAMTNAYNLGADGEREACAELCDAVDEESQSQWPKRLATMIRARGQHARH